MLQFLAGGPLRKTATAFSPFLFLVLSISLVACGVTNTDAEMNDAASSSPTNYSSKDANRTSGTADAAVAGTESLNASPNATPVSTQAARLTATAANSTSATGTVTPNSATPGNPTSNSSTAANPTPASSASVSGTPEQLSAFTAEAGTSPGTATPLATTAVSSNSAVAPTAVVLATEVPTAAPTATKTAVPAPVSSGDMASEAISILNQERADRGLGQLSYSASLTTAAVNYSRDMAEQGFFSHYGASGTSLPWDRAAAAGFYGKYLGECVNGGQQTAQQSITAWLNSSTHAPILLDPTATLVGIGYVYAPGTYYIHYWTLVVGR